MKARVDENRYNSNEIQQRERESLRERRNRETMKGEQRKRLSLEPPQKSSTRSETECGRGGIRGGGK